MTERHGLLALPTELIHTILLALPPLCIEHYSQTCKLARQHVYGDSKGDMHLWKQMYLQRFDDFEPLWSGPSVMPLVQLRDRAARLYAADPTNPGPISLNFNAVLSALLSVIDTAVPLEVSDLCRNATWLDDSVLTSGQPTWSEWIFPRTIMHGLDEFKIESAVNKSDSDNDNKRRRLTNNGPPATQSSNQASTSNSADTLNANKGSSSRRRVSSLPNPARPDSTRRRSARLLKLIYPESLHGLVDQGIDINSLARPQMRLAARVHCLHGIRAWKDSQRQVLTDSPQDIANQRQQDGLDYAGAAQALSAAANGRDVASDDGTPQPPSSATREDESRQNHQLNGREDTLQSSRIEMEEDGSQGQQAGSIHHAAAQGSARDYEQNGAGSDDNQGSEEDADEDDDDESFEEPPAAILRFRPRMFGPSFGFCSAPDEEDKVRARMRHRVYDSGYYGWSNGYGPLHSWRYDPQEGNRNNVEAEFDSEDGAGRGNDDDEMPITYAGEHGSQDADDDAFREAAELDDASDGIPDDPVPIEIEVGGDGNIRRTFQVADRYGNPININEPTGSELQANNHQEGDSEKHAWEISDDEVGRAPNATDRTPYQEPELGSYDANARTYTYEGHLPFGIVTGSQDIQITVGNTVDFVASGELNVRFLRPGMLAETMRVTSDEFLTRTARELGADGADSLSDEHPIVTDGDADEGEDADDDDFDEDADDWGADYIGEDEDEDNFGHFFDMFTPLAGASGYRGCHAKEEIMHLVKQCDVKRKTDCEDKKQSQSESELQRISLCRKSIHWELVEAIMVIMYANLKEAIWLENWGVGIRIPKVFDVETGVLIKDPMDKREFLEFPTGWNSSLPNPLPKKLGFEVDAGEESSKANHPKTLSSSDSKDEKPYDWARCESFWAGTYAFLDYSHFVDFNVRLARRRREALARAKNYGDSKKASGSRNETETVQSTPKPSLVGQEEAVGDCLQLRLELLPKSQQPAYKIDDEGQEDDEDYPTLFFNGTTVTYWGNEAPMPRGGVHGKVRPVYAREDDIDEMLTKGPRGKKKVEGLHWSLTHVYEGEDRWQLEGIQPGPPGTKAPIFGIWTDALHEAESPNGPFVYWMMDDRPWKEIEKINRQEARENAAARAAGNR